MRLTLRLVLVLAFSPFAAASADGSDAAQLMARAMARMMEAMGLFDDSPANPAGMSSWLPGMGHLSPEQMPWGQMPGYGALVDPIKAFGMQGMGEQAGAGLGWPWRVAPGALDGIWEGRDGGLMILRGRRFRLQAAQGGHIEGLFQRRDNRIAFYEPSTESVRAYELAEHQGRLVMRDAAGQTYLYRRLWLEAPSWDLSRGGSGN